MYYALVYFTKVQDEPINKIRQKYDPTYGLVDPHLTIMFPVPATAGKAKIIRHIDKIVKEWRPFQIHFSGFTKSWDHWLFLTLKEGDEQVRELWAGIYSGLLSQYRRDDIEFIPHIGLGLFVKDAAQYDLKDPHEFAFDEEAYRRALSEAEATIPDFWCTVDKLDLVELNDDITGIKSIKVFTLEPGSR